MNKCPPALTDPGGRAVGRDKVPWKRGRRSPALKSFFQGGVPHSVLWGPPASKLPGVHGKKEIPGPHQYQSLVVEPKDMPL